jgi:hypothetical protein
MDISRKCAIMEGIYGSFCDGIIKKRLSFAASYPIASIF